ncbi:DUF3298 and DUF4163 domain-containing protein [Aminipila luticellarii]|uniref:DUF3298/DUF4163 domain-containing protein n=1 Tax=Aminipila luticellarii TaxID=2507160 RepID=A0A410PVM1_9FIRM|nr:DUF3298 and DUF4163 domain-containing protein [Aminipila luticellarii]QAT42950.1 DUF3298/DUF4163 domain-containing protein [Aminipila luticellarii]
MNGKVIDVKKLVIQNEMKYNGEVVVTYKIEYPQFSSRYYQKSLKAMNKYYYNKAMDFQKFYRKELYKPAVEQYIYSKKNNFPIRVYEGLATYRVTYNMACIASLFYDNYIYLGGAHGSTIRTSETWNVQKARRMELYEMYECELDFKTYLLEQVKSEILKDPSIYFEDYDELIIENFNSQNYYCTSKGVILYYQQYDIAPYSSGIREFLIPYGDCITEPYKKCFFACD